MEARVNADVRREEIGLGSMAGYRQDMLKMYGGGGRRDARILKECRNR